MRRVIFMEEKDIKCKDYEDTEEKKRLTLERKRSRWKPTRKRSRRSIIQKVAVLGKKLSGTSFLHMEHGGNVSYLIPWKQYGLY